MKGLIKICQVFLLINLTTGCYAKSIESVVRDSESKTVKIGIILKDGEAFGSGAIISSDGIVLTCDHLFWEGHNKIFVKLDDGRTYRALVLNEDKSKDLALIKIETNNKWQIFKHFRLGKSVVKGQQVVAMGCPLGLQNTVTVGWVENIIEEPKFVVFHSAFINPGNSGGPLIDLHGKLIGINEAVVMQNIFFPANGMYIALDVDTIQDFLDESGI